MANTHHKPDGQFSALIEGPANPILTLSEAKAHGLVDHNDDDVKLTRLIEVATDYIDGADGVLGKALITQRWQETISAFPTSRFIILPVGPVQQVASLSYYSNDGVDTVMANDQYRLIVNGDHGVVELVDGASWPPTQIRSDAIRIQYDAGYGDASTDIPEGIRHAALMLVAHWYANTEAVVDYSISELPMAVKSLLFNKRKIEGLI